ncbi:MAG: hypothetical protein KAJ24_06270 [Candidatus Aenigmarchaeota archaeon]|nr:hypothetical protein [Candidatus Aenigmarchaeota archaeon]
MDRKILEDIGLTPKEVDVYLALISLDAASISEIRSKANVSRKSIYEILQKLLDKGLVSYIVKDNKKQYMAATPERFIELLKEKEANLETILPELLRKHKESEEETSIRVYVGKEGMKTITNNILKVEKPLYALVGRELILDSLKYYAPQFIKKRINQKIHAKLVYDESVRKRKIKIPLTEIRYVPNESASPISIIIYGDNLNLLIFTENPIAIHMKSKEIAQSFMNYFNVMWSIAKK